MSYYFFFVFFFFFFSSRRRHTRSLCDWSSDVCSSDLRVKDTVHHERRSLEFVFRTIAKIVRLDAPGYLEVAEVRRVDLIERPVARARRVRGVGRPLRVFRMILRPGNRRSQTEHHHPAHQSQTPVPHHSRKHVGFLLNSGGHLERSRRCLTTARPSYAQV